LRDFSELFSYLDLEKNNTPSFHLNPAYSVKFQELTDKISHHKNSIDTEYVQLKAKLVKDLNLFNFNGKITVSRMNTNQIAMLSNYADLQIENENFANITFSLRKNKEILDQEKEISKLENALFEEEKKVRELISARIRTESESLIFAFHEIAELDLLLAKAIFANKYKCVCPQINEEYRIEMAETENLILKDELKELKLEYQGQDFKINKSVVILTGANMAGKTSVLKTIGQCAALLIYGIPVPAKSANLFIPDFISFSGPLTHEHRADLSSFAIEVVALQHVLEKKNKGLILMDEFARGTNPLEGTALSQSVIDYFSRHEKGLFISATHFNPPAHTKNAQHFRLLGLSDQDFEYLKSLDKNYLKNNLKEIHKYFNYKIIPVNIDSEIPKAAYKIAELLGLDGEILDKAKELYNEEI
jgi:DNA mismatch repair ATPase MutS